MTRKELLNLIECYITVEGYTDLRSILSVMSQEYPGEFDRKQAIQAIREALKASASRREACAWACARLPVRSGAVRGVRRERLAPRKQP